MKPLTPKYHQGIADFLSSKDTVFAAARHAAGATHITFPQHIQYNLDRFTRLLEAHSLDYRIHFAHKPTKSPAIIREMERLGINIDVASRPELISALSAGFDGSRISCTGAKNTNFITLALQHNCTICVDSLDEIKRIAELYTAIGSTSKFLLRLTDAPCVDRTMRSTPTRFGIAPKDITKAYELLKASNLELLGFHVHHNEHSADIRAGYIEGLLTLIKQAHEHGFTPNILDIGGGMRTIQLNDHKDWRAYLDSVEDALKKGEPSNTWRDIAYGITVTRDSIAGRQLIEAKYPQNDYEALLNETFSTPLAQHPSMTIADAINEHMCTLMLEPGFALLDQCGVTLLRVIGTKQNAEGDTLIMLDGNMYNVGMQINELMLDATLVSNDENNDACSGYLIGNLCREEDFFARRKMSFKHTPKAGDIIAIHNTASYNADFEDASPHQHPLGTRIVALQDSDTPSSWELMNETLYNPYTI